MRRLIVPAVLAALLVPAAPALALNGVKPISPQKGDSVPAGRSVTFKMNITGDHNGVFVHVCKSKRKDKDGMICHGATLGRAKKKSGSRYEYKQRLYDYPAYWLNNPGTYYWQAYRTACNEAITDCKTEGPVVKFKVA